METVQVRMEVDKVTSANVHYLAQRLGITVKEAYALIVKLFLFERDLDKAFKNLNNHIFTVKQDTLVDEGEIPFEE